MRFEGEGYRAIDGLPKERMALRRMPVAMLGDDERAFFSAVAGLLPALFIAAILQREGTKDGEGTSPASKPSDTTAGPSPRQRLLAAFLDKFRRLRLVAYVRNESWPATVGFCVAIFLMLAGELAAFHVLRKDHVRAQDYGFVAVATVLLVAVIVGRIIRARTQSESKTVFAVALIVVALFALWFFAM